MQIVYEISDQSIEELSKKIAKSFSMTKDEALEMIYEEWELVESLFADFGKIHLVHQHLINEMNEVYRIA
ncbi:MAG: hypothetical protein IE885_04935 [Campylobacterales bacterium]|nr:hypothetical protein [Campylobacterales bacterium]